MTTLSALIPSCGRPHELRLCLAGLAGQAETRDLLQVVVVDDGSPEPYDALVNEFRDALDITLIRTENRGPAAARNTGIDHIRSPLVLLLDDDVRPRPGLFQHCVAFAEEHRDENDLLLVRMDPDDAVAAHPCYQYLESAGKFTPFPDKPGVYGPAFAWSGCLLLRRSLLDRARFREHLRAQEDTEWAARLHEIIPLRVHYDGAPLLEQTRPPTAESMLRRDYLWSYHLYFRQFDVDWLETAFDREERYQRPERHIITEPAELALLRRDIPILEALVRHSADPDVAELHRAELHAAYRRLRSHAMSLGWRDAKLARPALVEPRTVSAAALADPTGAGGRLPFARWRRDTGQPVLSAAIIVKNEARHLEACLESISELVDEVVVVDTGSTDDTVEVARACGALVHQIPWPNDFAAARNEALDRATGKWILYIDADERVIGFDREEIDTALANPLWAGLHVLLRAAAGMTPYREMRIFRNSEAVRFAGVIHENIWPALRAYAAQTARDFGICSIRMDHVGYEGDQTGKHERNLPLLLRSLEEDPSRIYHWCHLATVYEGLGRPEDARAALEQALAWARRLEGTGQLQVHAYLANLEHLRTLEEPIDELLDEALQRFPANLYLRSMDGERKLKSGDYEGAVASYSVILAGRDPLVRDVSVGYDEDLFGVTTMQPMAHALFRLKRNAEAAELYQALAARYPDDPEFRTKAKLCRVLAARAV